MNPAWMTLILSLPMLTLLHLLSKFINWQRSSGTFSTMTGRPTWSYSRILTMTLPDTQFRSSRRQIWSILPVTWRNLQGLLSNEARRMEISSNLPEPRVAKLEHSFLWSASVVFRRVVLGLPSGPAEIRTTTGSLSALARPTPYQLSHRVALRNSSSRGLATVPRRDMVSDCTNQ